MKIRLCMVLAAAALLASCSSSKPISLADYGPVAIVSIYGNSAVPWYVDSDDKSGQTQDETSSGMLTGLLNRTLNGSNPEVQTVNSRIDDAASTLLALLDDNGIAVVENGIVQEAEAVKKTGNFFLKKYGDMVPADGYKCIDAGNSSAIRLIAGQTGAQSVMYVRFSFQKIKENVGLIDKAVRARVVMAVTVAGSDGSKIFTKEYVTTSAKSVFYKNGDWDKEAVVALFPQTVEDAVRKFMLDMTGGLPSAVQETDPALREEAVPIRMPSI